jgi:hypothetical protein
MKLKLGMRINYVGDFRETVAKLADFEGAGVTISSVHVVVYRQAGQHPGGSEDNQNKGAQPWWEPNPMGVCGIAR